MFGKKKKNKKEKKVEKVFADSANENESVNDQSAEGSENELTEEEIMMGMTEKEDDDDLGLSDHQKAKLDKLSSVRDKISKILKASNIEIIDENFGDEYETGDGVVDGVQQQQDYDSLKAMFGAKDKAKGKELTLTLDEYDYTHTGQYIEEFDLMHLKGIKKVRIHKKQSKWVKRIIIAASIIVVVAVGVVLGLQLTKKEPIVLTSISLNQSAGVYFVNDSFDYSGLYIYAKYSDGSVQKIKLNNNNFAGTVGGNNNTENGNIKFLGGSPVNITFSFGGLSTTYVAEVKTKVQDGLQAFYDDSLFLLNSGDVVTNDYLRVFALYRDNNPADELEINNKITLVVNGVNCTYSSVKKGIVLDNIGSSITSIVVKFGEYELALDSALSVVQVKK